MRPPWVSPWVLWSAVGLVVLLAGQAQPRPESSSEHALHGPHASNTTTVQGRGYVCKYNCHGSYHAYCFCSACNDGTCTWRNPVCNGKCDCTCESGVSND